MLFRSHTVISQSYPQTNILLISNLFSQLTLTAQKDNCLKSLYFSNGNGVTGYVLYPEYQFQIECSKETLSESFNQPTGQCKSNIANPSTGQIRLPFIGIITEYLSNHLVCSYLIVFHDISVGFGIHGYSIDSLWLNEIAE